MYGPHQDSNRFISQLIISSLKKKKFPTSLGIQCRDFLYVTDAVNAILKLIKCKKNIKGQIINIGFGKCVKLKKVMELVNGQKSAGYHTVELNANGLSSGIYFYTITTSDYSKTMKMMLIK